MVRLRLRATAAHVGTWSIAANGGTWLRGTRLEVTIVREVVSARSPSDPHLRVGFVYEALLTAGFPMPKRR